MRLVIRLEDLKVSGTPGSGIPIVSLIFTLIGKEEITPAEYVT